MVIEFKDIKINNKCSKYHTIDDHNFWIRRNGTCPYCRLGSKPVHKTQLIMLNNDFVGGVKKQ